MNNYSKRRARRARQRRAEYVLSWLAISIVAAMLVVPLSIWLSLIVKGGFDWAYVNGAIVVSCLLGKLFTDAEVDF